MNSDKNNSKTILLVEDDIVTAIFEKRLLNDYGYNIIRVESGEKAIETVLNNDDIDLILMDIDLGYEQIDGTETAEIILKSKEIPIVFLSSHTEPEIVEKTEKITSYGYVVKNTGITVLDASIKMAFKLYNAKQSEKEKEKEILLNQKRLEGLVLILQYETNDIQQFLDYTLDKAIELTDSKIGYIYYYNEEKKEFILNTWSKEVMHQCTINNPQTIYNLEKTGIWGEAVRQKKPIMLNDFQADNPLKKGYPTGHAPYINFSLFRFFTTVK